MISILRRDDTPRSVVYRKGEWVYKRARKTLIDNEMWALEALAESGFVPAPAERLELELLRLPYVESEPVTDTNAMWWRGVDMLEAFRQARVRHGDLTAPHVFVVDNRPVVIDWGECRHWDDPRPDKRPEGDEYWLSKTIRELIDAN